MENHHSSTASSHLEVASFVAILHSYVGMGQNPGTFCSPQNSW